MNRPTLLLLCSALVFLSVSCAAYRQGYADAEREAKEAWLRRTLFEMRNDIDLYTAKEGHPPQKLEDMVTAGYFRAIPNDPMTEKPDWTLVMNNCAPKTPCKEGIKDIHSASKVKSSRGNLYSDW